MGYKYKPTYYSTLQDSITTFCKSMLPFSFNKPLLTATELKLSKQQCEYLKWQQSSFHHILKLIGLYNQGLLNESEVSAFRTQVLDTLIAAKGCEYEHLSILRDKLLFLQELLYAKCISAEEYHASKRPLLQRLAVQGAELHARDVIVGPQTEKSEVEEWSVIDLRDEQSTLEKDNSTSKNKWKHGPSVAIKQIKDAASNLGIGSFQKLGKNIDQRSIFDMAANNHTFPFDNTDMSTDANAHTSENSSETESILMSECSTPKSDKFGKECQGTEKGKKKTFRSLFHKEGRGVNGENDNKEEKGLKSARKQWRFDGLKKWKWNNEEEETTPLPPGEKSSDDTDYKLVASSVAKGPDTKATKRKPLLDSPSSAFIIDKVLGDKIKKELSRIQTELSSNNSNFEFSEDQMDAISTKLPVDKSDLKQFFPKSWCDRYGDVVLDAVKKEYKEHVAENIGMRNATLERRKTSSKRWTTFEDDENCDPNVHIYAPPNDKRSASIPDQNPFWNRSSIQGQ